MSRPTKYRSGTSPTASTPALGWARKSLSRSIAILSPEWTSDPADTSVWDGVTQIPDEELWRAHERSRARLVSWARAALKEQLVRRGASYDEVTAADQVLDPEALDHRLRTPLCNLQTRDVAACATWTV